MLFSLLVTAREGIEIALIVTILLGYLRRIDQKRRFREIWYGVAAAAALSLAVRLLRLARIPGAVPIAASALMTIGMIWFFVRLRV